jgi:putative DNA methylase
MALISTDPPYYDNIGYATCLTSSNGGLRRSLRDVFPDTIQHSSRSQGPGTVATPYPLRRQQEEGRTLLRARAWEGVRAHGTQTHSPDTPDGHTTHSRRPSPRRRKVTAKEPVTSWSSTGWETMLERLLGAGFLWLTAHGRCVGSSPTASLPCGSNALASSIVLDWPP